MTTSTATQSIAKTLGIYSRTDRTQLVVLDTIARMGKRGELAFNAGVIASGIAWVMLTGRLWGAQETALRNLSAYQTCKLVQTMLDAGISTDAGVYEYLKGGK